MAGVESIGDVEMTSLMIKGLQEDIKILKADIEYWKHCAEFGSLSGKVALEQTIDSQKQTADALIKKVKIATDALQIIATTESAGAMKYMVESTAMRFYAKQALSQIQQEKI